MSSVLVARLCDGDGGEVGDVLLRKNMEIKWVKHGQGLPLTAKESEKYNVHLSRQSASYVLLFQRRGESEAGR